ncbi:MAG: TolC family protein [Planctomycetales bacterium]
MCSCAKRSAIVSVVLGMLALGLSGCNIPRLRHMDSTPIIPEDFRGRTSAENSAQIGIAEFFNDPVLTGLLTYGLAQNQELRIRNEEVQIANNEILARRGAYLPFLNIGLNGGMDRNSRYMPLGAAEDQLTWPNGGNFPDPMARMGLGSNLFWQVDIWRQLRNARDAAYLRYVAAYEARNYLITKLVSETADNYYELSALDQRLVYLNQTIDLQQKSLEVARLQKAAARGTELGVQRFLAEVRKNESQRQIINQRIIEVENRINFLVGRYPQPVARELWDFINLNSRVLQVGVPVELLGNRRDIRAAEQEVAACGLDILVARKNFYPKLILTGRVGYEAFNPKFLFDPASFAAAAAGELVAPLMNKKAIQAEYMNANARQLQAIYNYQRTILNAFTEVVNLMAKVENYRESVLVKQEQVRAMEASVTAATDLFQNVHLDVNREPEVKYIDVLFAQRDLLEARTVLIETKQQQFSAIVNAYRALGGGYLLGTGEEFDDLFFMPPVLQFEEMEAPAAPAEATLPAPNALQQTSPDAPKAPGEES